MEAFERLENDFNWRVYFAGENSSFKPKQLYVKTELCAPLPPHQLGLRMSAFELEFKKLFKCRPKMKSNLPRFLEDLLSNLRGMKQIIFASADKNLGPVAVTLEQYIKDALTHLLDSNTYEILSSAEAEARDRDLRTAISNWISKYVIDLDIDTRRYMRKKRKATKDDRFGYFYLLYKIHKKKLWRELVLLPQNKPHLTFPQKPLGRQAYGFKISYCLQ